MSIIIWFPVLLNYVVYFCNYLNTIHMNPDTHRLYTLFSKSNIAHQKMQKIKDIAQLETFVQTHFICVYDDTIDTYNRSFDYRHGIWYKRIKSLTLYYNVLEHTIYVCLISRIVDNMFVDRSIPLVVEHHLNVRDIQNTLMDMIRPHLRSETLSLQQAFATLDTNINQILANTKHMVCTLLNAYGVTHDVSTYILTYVY